MLGSTEVVAATVVSAPLAVVVVFTVGACVRRTGGGRLNWRLSEASGSEALPRP